MVSYKHTFIKTLLMGTQSWNIWEIFDRCNYVLLKSCVGELWLGLDLTLDSEAKMIQLLFSRNLHRKQGLAFQLSYQCLTSQCLQSNISWKSWEKRRGGVTRLPLYSFLSFPLTFACSSLSFKWTKPFVVRPLWC